MQHETFDTPVVVLVGLGMPRSVGSVFEAYAFLAETAAERHSRTRGAAITACLDAMNRIGSARAAREAFETYAQAAGIRGSDIVEWSIAAPRAHSSSLAPIAA